LEDKVAIMKKREKLTIAVSRFEELANKYIAVHEGDNQNEDLLGDEAYLDSDGEELPEVVEIDMPEKSPLQFPSSFSLEDRIKFGLESMATTKLHLRIAYADDLLTRIRTTIGQKSMHYVKNYRAGDDKTHRTRARNIISNIDRELDQCRRIYMRNRQLMAKLGLSNSDLANRYAAVTRQDLKASPALQAPNDAGQSNTELSWIWTAGVTISEDNYLSECELTCHQQLFNHLTNIFQFIGYIG